MRSKEKLCQFGLYTLGQIAALPPGPLLSQFGTEGKKIYELARGYDGTPLYPRMMEKAIEESTTLSSVTVSMEAVLVALERLLVKIFDRISSAGLGIHSLCGRIVQKHTNQFGQLPFYIFPEGRLFFGRSTVGQAGHNFSGY